MSSQSRVFSVPFGGGATLNLSLDEVTNDLENTSRIVWRAWVELVGYEFNYNNYFVLQIDGNTIYDQNPGRVSHNAIFAQGSVDVPHEADGTKLMTVFAEYTQPYGESGYYDPQIDDSMELSRITGATSRTLSYTAAFGYGATLHLQVDEVTNDTIGTSNLTWSVWVEMSGYAYNYNNYLVIKLDNETLYSQNPGAVVDGVVFARGSTSVKHDSDGDRSVLFVCRYTQPYGTYGYYDVTISEVIDLLSISSTDQYAAPPGGLYAVPYAIFANDICIYNSASTAIDKKAISPKLELSANTSGTLTMTLPIVNAGYNLDRKTTIIRVFQYGNELWEGRILQEEYDFYNNRSLTCEGELSYLHDSVLEPYEFSSVTISDFLSHVITSHNSKVGYNKRFTLGNVYPSDSETVLSATIDYIDSFEAIQTVLIDGLGGYLRIRKENGYRYLDYYEFITDLPESDQPVKLGVNLLDLKRTYSIEEYATRLIPLGKSLDTETIEGVKDRVTVESITGTIYVDLPDAIKAYGVIEAIADFSEVEDPQELYDLAMNKLQDLQDDMVSIDASAVDLSYANPNITPIRLLDVVGVESRQHSEEPLYFAVTKRTYTFDNPSDDKLTLGIEIKKSLSSYMSYYFKNN